VEEKLDQKTYAFLRSVTLEEFDELRRVKVQMIQMEASMAEARRKKREADMLKRWEEGDKRSKEKEEKARKKRRTGLIGQVGKIAEDLKLDVSAFDFLKPAKEVGPDTGKEGAEEVEMTEDARAGGTNVDARVTGVESGELPMVATPRLLGEAPKGAGTPRQQIRRVPAATGPRSSRTTARTTVTPPAGVMKSGSKAVAKGQGKGKQ
jgi:hypothetical protein